VIRAVLLDLDDTLLDDRGATRAAAEAFLAAYPEGWRGQSSEEAFSRWRTVSGVHWKRLEAGEIGFLEQRRERVRDFLGTGLTDAEADAAYEPYRQAYEAHWRLVPGARQFLDRTRHLPRVLVTNGDSAQQHRKVEAVGLNGEFLAVLTPAEAGCWKPAPEFFHRALAILSGTVPGLRPEEVLMLGDDPPRDLEPARSLGLATARIEPQDGGASLARALSLIETPEAVVQRQFEAFRDRNLTAWLDTYADDAVQYAFPAEEVARGRVAIAARMAGRFADDPAQAARLVHRIVVGDTVVDHEVVTRTFPEGVRDYELICTYLVRDGRIQAATFAFGPRR